MIDKLIARKSKWFAVNQSEESWIAIFEVLSGFIVNTDLPEWDRKVNCAYELLARINRQAKLGKPMPLMKKEQREVALGDKAYRRKTCPSCNQELAVTHFLNGGKLCFDCVEKVKRDKLEGGSGVPVPEFIKACEEGFVRGWSAEPKEGYAWDELEMAYRETDESLRARIKAGKP